MSNPAGKRRVLLTGGSGFIGKNLLDSALVDRYELVAPSHADLDLMNEDTVLEYIRNGHFDIILHAAAKPGHRAAKDPSGILYANTRIFFNLARAIDNVSKMIVLGSGAIYDSRFYHPLMKEEEFGLHVPADEHGFSKYVIQKYISNDKRFVDLRLFGVFGKHEEYSIRFISNMICKSLFDLPLTMHQNRRFSYLFVEDLPAIVGHFIDSDHRHDAYNVTPNETHELKEIAEIVRAIARKDLPIHIELDGLGPEYSGSNERLRAEWHAVRFTPFNKAIESLFRWYSENRFMIDKNKLLLDR